MTKFLTYEDRLEIAACLKDGCSFGKIGNRLGRDRTTISKEIRKHSYERKSGYSGSPYNACRHKLPAKPRIFVVRTVCVNQFSTVNSAASANDFCPDFVENICTSRFKPPYVCNGCGEYYKCSLKKTIYDAADAHIAFSENLSQSRSGILSDEKEIARLNA